ncbi:MAG TPA: phosphatidylglycerol lysyltransferase domain-containing protein [Candidatus Paceibacterota bacterium]|nr:phosphatidylglycerol lysyltransferase domain-containing protein [Candidatus Paceibacterota bacterium]
MIPQFPAFKNFELYDKEEIEKYTSAFPPYAEYQFTTMCCWEIHQPFQLSIINENLLIKQTNCLTGEYFFSLVGTNSLPQTFNEISVFFHQHHLPLILRCVPEEIIKNLDGIPVKITEDRDNFDYIYRVSDFYHAQGNKYKVYRQKSSRFIENNPGIITRQTDLTDNKIKNQIITLFDTWTNNKEAGHKECEPSCELKALNKLLSSAKDFKGLVALGVFDKEEMIAFSINDINDKKYMTGLFWKANTNYKGIYQFLMNEIVKFSQCRGIEFLNWESDLGIESLRRSKTDLHPAFFLKKHTVEFLEI